jgi:hypothetical protein
MTEKETKHASKFLSLVLRHEPERIGLKLGDAGWVGVTELLEAVNRHGVSLIGDEPGRAGESNADAARRELLEETGYDAEHIEPLTTARLAAASPQNE